MLKLRQVAKAGLKFNKNYLNHGNSCWKNPDALQGYDECKEAVSNITWDDCISAVGYNTNYLFEQPIATHVLYEMANLRIMLIFFGGGCIMPIHDHEGMTVFSKCIRGAVEAEYWDVKQPQTFYDDVRSHEFAKYSKE